MEGLRQESQVVGIELVRLWPQRENMVLVKAALDLPVPDCPAAELVEVASFRHEHITGPEAAARGHPAGDGDLGYVI